MNIRIWNTENVSVVGVLNWVFSTWEHYRWKNILQRFTNPYCLWHKNDFWQLILYKLLFIIFSRYMLRNRSKPRGKFKEQDIHEADMELDARMLWYFRNKKKALKSPHQNICILKSVTAIPVAQNFVGKCIRCPSQKETSQSQPREKTGTKASVTPS